MKNLINWKPTSKNKQVLYTSCPIRRKHTRLDEWGFVRKCILVSFVFFRNLLLTHSNFRCTVAFLHKYAIMNVKKEKRESVWRNVLNVIEN